MEPVASVTVTKFLLLVGRQQRPIPEVEEHVTTWGADGQPWIVDDFHVAMYA